MAEAAQAVLELGDVPTDGEQVKYIQYFSRQFSRHAWFEAVLSDGLISMSSAAEKKNQIAST